MHIFSYISVLLITLTSTLSHAKESVIYHIKTDTTNASKVNVSVDTSSLSKFTLVPARVMSNDFQPKINCINSKGISSKPDYNKVVQCDAVHWTLDVPVVDKGGLDASQQIDKRDANKGWYFISEFNSLPRIKKELNDQQDMSIVVCLPDRKCELLPTSQQPPLLLVWGMKSTSIKLNEKDVLIKSDTAQVLDNLTRWKPTLEKQLNYLNKVLSNQHVVKWEIILFGRDKATGSIGGAAGSNSILINASLDGNKLTHQSIQMLLKIAAHESAHILNTTQMPVWASESLAEYYAIKSLRFSEFEPLDPTAQWLVFADKFPFAKTGLIEASEYVQDKEEYQYYPLFYIKGAAFWNDLDNALIGKGTSLDSLVNELTFANDYRLSSEFTKRVIKIIDSSKWEIIAQKYL